MQLLVFVVINYLLMFSLGNGKIKNLGLFLTLQFNSILFIPHCLLGWREILLEVCYVYIGCTIIYQ